VKIIETVLPGCVVIEPDVHGDARGFFYESYNAEKYKNAGFDLRFMQTNVSRSAHGVLRGLHYQYPNPQGKLVSRVGSQTFGRWAAAILSAANKRHFWVPEGFAHGFVVLSEFATFSYQCTALYDRAADAGIRWNDAEIGIDWPISAPQLSDKDEKAPFLRDVPREALPRFDANG